MGTRWRRFDSKWQNEVLIRSSKPKTQLLILVLKKVLERHMLLSSATPFVTGIFVGFWIVDGQGEFTSNALLLRDFEVVLAIGSLRPFHEFRRALGDSSIRFDASDIIWPRSLFLIPAIIAQISYCQITANKVRSIFPKLANDTIVVEFILV